MKKLLCILLSALMMALPLSSLAEEAAPTPEPFQAQALVTEEKLEQMIPVLDSFANTMGIEGEYTYDIQRPELGGLVRRDHPDLGGTRGARLADAAICRGQL